MNKYDYDYDPKFGLGDGGIEFGGFRRNAAKALGSNSVERLISVVPYDGTEDQISVTVTTPTFSAGSEWHNRPA